MKATIVRTNGTTEVIDIKGDVWRELHRLLDCETFDTVNLRDGRVMLVDDNGWNTKVVKHTSGIVETVEVIPTTPNKPINAAATRLYHSICVPGTTHQIVGDVAVVNDADFT